VRDGSGKPGPRSRKTVEEESVAFCFVEGLGANSPTRHVALWRREGHTHALFDTPFAGIKFSDAEGADL